jgi:ribokinase
MNEKILACDLKKVSMFLMNEDEGMAITGKQEPADILAAMAEMYPDAQTVLTLGSKGSVYQGNGRTIEQKAFRVKAVDTTAAGDTFTGYLLAGMARGEDMAKCLEEGAKASAIAVTRPGATTSIPVLAEVQAAEL